MKKLIIAAMLISSSAYAQEAEDEDYYDAPQQVRPLGGQYYRWENGDGQGWSNYTGGHGCYTSTVNGYSVTSCH